MNSLMKQVFGFDPFAEHFSAVENLMKAAYPKYDLVKNDDGSFSLELAVAGFNKDELSVVQRQGSLLIEGKSMKEACQYIYKGISTKPFRLIVPMSVDWKLKQVNLLNGILKISFVTKEPEVAQKVEIQVTSEPVTLTQESKND